MLLLVAAVATADSAWGATATLAPVKDNTLYETAGGEMSNGAGVYVFAGRTLLFGLRRAVLSFDVAGAIPAGATINSATLTLNVSQSNSGDHPAALHRLGADWGESTSDAGSPGGLGAPSAPGDATWIHTFFPSQLWSAAGGDFDATASATIPVGGLGPYTWGSTAAMVADVQGWLDTPAANFGWILIGDEGQDGLGAAKRYDSSESVDPLLAPTLTVDYTATVVPAASTWDLVLLAVLLIAAGTLVYRRRLSTS
jgi:hypothetical protein